MFESESSAFVTLAQIARENDSQAALILRGLVAKPTAERVLLVDKVAQQLEAAGLDRKVVKALRYLSSDALAERLRQLLG